MRSFCRTPHSICCVDRALIILGDAWNYQARNVFVGTVFKARKSLVADEEVKEKRIYACYVVCVFFFNVLCVA